MIPRGYLAWKAFRTALSEPATIDLFNQEPPEIKHAWSEVELKLLFL